MRTQTKITQDNLNPNQAQRILSEGNKRFMQNVKALRNLQDQVVSTREGQFPFAIILSCIDSRVPVELVFDQGIGDVFSVRVAGNIINEDVLGSMEYGCKVAGSKIVVVMGHTKCGAIEAAWNGVKMGNITSLLSKLEPAVKIVRNMGEDTENLNEVSIQNVKVSIDQIRSGSPILAEMERKGEIKIVGALYSVESGEVTFND